MTTPTYVQGGVLDLVFTNNSCVVHSYNTLKPLRTTSDHFVVEVNTPLMCNDCNLEEEKPAMASPLDCLNFHSNDIQWDKICDDVALLTDCEEFTSLAPNCIKTGQIHGYCD